MSILENQELGDRNTKNIQRRMRGPVDRLQKGLRKHKPTDAKEVAETPITPRGARNSPDGRKSMNCSTEFKATPEMQECIHFLSRSVGKDDSTIKQELDAFQHKDKLKQLLGHMMSASLGGWKDNGLYLVSESGNCASKRFWDVNNGKLVFRGNNVCPDFDIDKLWRVRSLI
jgi:hypothetical protein